MNRSTKSEISIDLINCKKNNEADTKPLNGMPDDGNNDYDLLTWALTNLSKNDNEQL